MSAKTLQDIPIEIIDIIAGRLHISDLCSLAATCRVFGAKYTHIVRSAKLLLLKRLLAHGSRRLGHRPEYSTDPEMYLDCQVGDIITMRVVRSDNIFWLSVVLRKESVIDICLHSDILGPPYRHVYYSTPGIMCRGQVIWGPDTNSGYICYHFNLVPPAACVALAPTCQAELVTTYCDSHNNRNSCDHIYQRLGATLGKITDYTPGNTLQAMWYEDMMLMARPIYSSNGFAVEFDDDKYICLADSQRQCIKVINSDANAIELFGVMLGARSRGAI